MENKQICVECGSDDLISLAPEYPHVLECNACGHPNDAPVNKSKPVEEKEVKCKICKKRKAETNVLYNEVIVDACMKCFTDVMEEEE